MVDEIDADILIGPGSIPSFYGCKNHLMNSSSSSDRLQDYPDYMQYSDQSDSSSTRDNYNRHFRIGDQDDEVLFFEGYRYKVIEIKNSFHTNEPTEGYMKHSKEKRVHSNSCIILIRHLSVS